MDDWPTDAMTDAYVRVMSRTDVARMGLSKREEDAVAAALAAAPTADGWVWCEHSNGVNWRDEEDCWSALWELFARDCPGPHRTLIIGPTEETT